MKITALKTYILQQELDRAQHFAFSQSWYRRRTICICRIDTDEGISGWGEAFGPAQIHKATIDKYFSDYLLRKDPFDSQVIWETLYNAFRDNGQKGNIVEALSAIDIALWDIKGRALGRPIYQLLGGRFRERLLPYATGMYRQYVPNEFAALAREAEGYCARGFPALKMKIGFGLDYDYNAVRAVREAVGDDVRLMVDANHAYNARSAIEVGRALEEFAPSWYEEPVPPEDIRGYMEVKNALEIPIAGGEAEFTRWGMHRLIESRAVDIVQPDCTVTGGFSEFQNIVLLCSIANIQCFPHIWGSSIALAAGMHAAFALPHFPPSLEPQEWFFEYDQTENIFREELATEKPDMRGGWIYPNEKPGLGIEINEDLIDHYALD